MGKIIGVTGWNGFIGKHLISKLSLLGFEIMKGDTLFPKTCGCIIHLAAKTHTRNEFDFNLIKSNIVLTEFLYHHNPKVRIINISSCSAMYMTNPYSLSKLYGEQLSLKHSNSVSLRLFNVYGPNNTKGVIKFLIDVPEGGVFNGRGLSAVRDYIHVSDVVDEIIRCIESEETGVLDVGTGVPTSTYEIINLYKKLSGKRFNLHEIPLGLHEPWRMVSNRKVGKITLEEGLLKLINE